MTRDTAVRRFVTLIVALAGFAPVTLAQSGQDDVVQVGHDVPPPQKTRDSPAFYPGQQDAQARRVMLRLRIARDGSVKSAAAVQRNADDRILEAALGAAKLWRYAPTVLDGAARELELVAVVNVFPAPQLNGAEVLEPDRMLLLNRDGRDLLLPSGAVRLFAVQRASELAGLADIGAQLRAFDLEHPQRPSGRSQPAEGVHLRLQYFDPDAASHISIRELVLVPGSSLTDPTSGFVYSVR